MADTLTDVPPSSHGVALSSLELKRSRSGDLDGDQNPPAKKARKVLPSAIAETDTEATDMDSVALAALRGRYKRDPTYYMEDGSCILLVEDTLFNVRTFHDML